MRVGPCSAGGLAAGVFLGFSSTFALTETGDKITGATKAKNERRML
jgi:hypothetical protein